MSDIRPAAMRRSVGAQYLEVRHGDVVHRVLVKQVAQARRFTLKVRAGTRDAVLTMPPRGSMARARAFAERHAAWIDARLARLPRPEPLGPGSLVLFRGVPHEVVHRPGTLGPVWVEAGDPPRLCVSGDGRFVQRRLHDFFRRSARSDLVRAASRHAATLGLSIGRLTIRDTSSRWGSCSSTGTLSFSWRLILAPPDVLDYLAVHEVAHLKHMNHSDAFWALVARLRPDYRTSEAWLKRHGSDLMNVGRSETARPVSAAGP